LPLFNLSASLTIKYKEFSQVLGIPTFLIQNPMTNISLESPDEIGPGRICCHPSEARLARFFLALPARSLLSAAKGSESPASKATFCPAKPTAVLITYN
jgi:hypothetical protein